MTKFFGYMAVIVGILILAGAAFGAVPENPGPSKTRAERMAEIYRVPEGETFNQGGDASTGNGGADTSTSE